MRSIWPRLRARHLNTVPMPVSWELIEPAEGRFDFAPVDGLLADARAADQGRHLRLPPGRPGVQRVRPYRYR